MEQLANTPLSEIYIEILERDAHTPEQEQVQKECAMGLMSLVALEASLNLHPETFPAMEA